MTRDMTLETLAITREDSDSRLEARVITSESRVESRVIQGLRLESSRESTALHLSKVEVYEIHNYYPQMITVT